jgi:hypothetical protein
MAKLSRSALKGIVKECLVEILNEGILNEAPTRTRQLRESSRATSLGVGESRATSRAHQASRRIGLDSITYGSQEDSAPNEKFEKNVTNAVSNLTKDPVLSSIFQGQLQCLIQWKCLLDLQIIGLPWLFKTLQSNLSIFNST